MSGVYASLDDKDSPNDNNEGGFVKNLSPIALDQSSRRKKKSAPNMHMHRS